MQSNSGHSHMQITGANTPCLVYQISQLKENVEFYKDLLPTRSKIYYATMANCRKEIIEWFSRQEIGFFVNSLSHLELVQEIVPEIKEIIFAASGNDLAEMETVNLSTAKVFVDSAAQFSLFQKLQSSKPIGLRLNISSLIDFEVEVPFFSRIGIEKKDAIRLLLDYGNKIDSLHIYCGTNVVSSSLYLLCLRKIAEIVKDFDNIKSIDLGGGFPSMSSPYARDILSDIKHCWETNIHLHKLHLIVEPGRALVDNIANLYVKVNDVKYVNGHNIILVNSSYTCYPRKVIHRINEQSVSVIGKEEIADKIEVFICGSTTFSNDILTTCFLPHVEIGDVICIKNAGAYVENSYLSYLGCKQPKVIIL